MLNLEDILRILGEAYPDRCLPPSTSEKDFIIYAAKVELIRFIHHKIEESQESLPEVLK